PTDCSAIYLTGNAGAFLGSIMIEQGGPQVTFHSTLMNPYEGGTCTSVGTISCQPNANIANGGSNWVNLATRSCARVDVVGNPDPSGYFPMGCAPGDYLSSVLTVSGGICGAGQNYVITSNDPLPLAGGFPTVYISGTFSPIPNTTCKYQIGRPD